MLKKIIKKPFCCECCAFVVPSVTIKEVTPTGTIPCLDRVCFRGGKNENPVIGQKTRIITTHAVANDNRRQTAQFRVCAAIRRLLERLAGWRRTATGRNTYGSVMNINPIFTTGDFL